MIEDDSLSFGLMMMEGVSFISRGIRWYKGSVFDSGVGDGVVA